VADLENLTKGASPLTYTPVFEWLIPLLTTADQLLIFDGVACVSGGVEVSENRSTK
jgi:hypothetical protein